MAGDALPLAYRLSFTGNGSVKKRISGVLHPKCEGDFRPQGQKFAVAEGKKSDQISGI